MATSTLANSPNPQRLFAPTARLVGPPRHPKAQPDFRVFPTGSAEYHWRIAASATDRTISRHKSLTLALRKCTSLNKQCSEGARHATN